MVNIANTDSDLAGTDLADAAQNLFSLRPARLADQPYLENLFWLEGMPVPPIDDLLQGTVAVNPDDEPVGFIRVLTIEQQDEQQELQYRPSPATPPCHPEIGCCNAQDLQLQPSEPDAELSLRSPQHDMEWGLNVRGAKGNGHYVYPVIVFANWRKLGVASALVRYELKRHGQLKLVACRPSRGFYERSGFAHETWENIAYQIARDCEQCPNLKSCDPQPFVISR